MSATTKLLPLLLGITLASASAQASPAAPPKTQSVKDVRKTARDRFAGYLSSSAHLGSLDTNAKMQLFGNLKAPMRASSFQPYFKYLPDAALLMEVVGKSQNAPTGGTVELASRYGARLTLVRTPSPGHNAAGYKVTELLLQVVSANGVARNAEPADLAVFGITKPKHFDRVLSEAMEKIAPEDYE